MRLLPGVGKLGQIAAAFEREIRAGVFAFGDELQNENTLVQRGMITTRFSIGSSVAYDGQQVGDTVGRRSGRNPHPASDMIEDPTLASELRLETDYFLSLDRLRLDLEDGHGVELECSRIVVAPELEHLPKAGLLGMSLNQTLHATGPITASGEKWVDIGLPTLADARRLRAAGGDPFLRTRRLTRWLDGMTIEYVVSLVSPTHLALHLEF